MGKRIPIGWNRAYVARPGLSMLGVSVDVSVAARHDSGRISGPNGPGSDPTTPGPAPNRRGGEGGREES